MAGHRGWLHTFPLKKPKFFGVTCAFGYNIKIYRYAETLASTGICPAPASNPKSCLVVSYSEICDIIIFALAPILAKHSNLP